MSAVLDLTRELTARPSVTPDDAGCQRLISERLLPLGFEVEWFLSGAVSNVLLTRGGGSPALWFLGHTDVVPTGPEELWTFLPFHPDEKNGELYGRGVADMKGAVAAMVIALENFARRWPDHAGEIGLLLTSDEEGEAVDGIARYGSAGAVRSTCGCRSTACRGTRPSPRTWTTRCTASRPSSKSWWTCAGTPATTIFRPATARWPTSAAAPARAT
jgi:succinyl-diaminopimelate desuccinylase